LSIFMKIAVKCLRKAKLHKVSEGLATPTPHSAEKRDSIVFIKQTAIRLA